MGFPSNSSLLCSLSFLIFLLVITRANSWSIQDEYLNCLRSQNSDSIGITYNPTNSSYLPIFESSVQNFLPESSSPVKPYLIHTPTEESEIQAVVRCARKVGILIRVRSGGHDYEGLSYASTVPFVLIDLRNFNSISIDTKSNTAWIRAGATLGELYYAIGKTSRTLAFSGGVCPTVGSGGLFTGGGYGMMLRKYGLAADNILDAKIVDVNGRVLDRKAMGEDLFWAIRGGGGTSFGIVTEWKIHLVSVPEKVTVFNVIRTLEQNATQLVNKWQYVADRIDENLLMRLNITVIPSQNGNKTVQFSFISLFLGGADELLKVTKQSFPELGLTKDDCQELSWIEAVLFFARIPKGTSLDVLLNRTQPGRGYFKGKSDYATQPISENGLEAIWEKLLVLEEDGVPVEVDFTPYGGIMSEISESATPFPHRAGTLYMISYELTWENEADSAYQLSRIRELYSFMTPYVSKSPRAAYFNYRDIDLGRTNIEGNTSYKTASVWGTKYFKKNFDRLVYVKTKVDPENFFRNEQSIPPLAKW